MGIFVIGALLYVQIVTFGDNAQSPTVPWTLSYLASGDGRLSAWYDKGEGGRDFLWKFECHATLTGTNVIGSEIEYYIETSDATPERMNDDRSMPWQMKNFLRKIGTLVVNQTTSNVEMAIGLRNIPISKRYFRLGVWNASTLSFSHSSMAHGCTAAPE